MIHLDYSTQMRSNLVAALGEFDGKKSTVAIDVRIARGWTVCAEEQSRK